MSGFIVGCATPGSEVAEPVVPPAVTTEPPVVIDEPDPIDEYRPDLGRPGFETPDIILRCGDHQMSGEIFEDRLEFSIDGGDYVLNRIEAEDGDMFSDGTFTLWNLENDWGLIDETTGEAYECFVAAIS